MNTITESIISEVIIPYGSTDAPPSQYYKWKIEIRHPSGGLIRSAFIGANNFFAKNVNFGLTERGCETASLQMAKIDFPVYYGCDVVIYKNGERRYAGYISNIPNSENDTIKITPYIQRLSELSINTTYTNYTGREILQNAIESISTDSKILWNNSIVKYDDTSVFENVSYKYEKVKKVIEDYYQNQDDAYYGVNAYNNLYIKERASTISHILYHGLNQPFRSLEYSKDYSQIKQNVYDIFQKSTDTNENVFIATIPDGSSNYPYNSNKNVVGLKRDKLIAPNGLNSTECKDYAFAKINAQVAPENIKITGIDIDRFDLSIGQKIRIWENEKEQLFQVNACESTENWTGAVSLSDDYIEGSNSIEFSSSNYVIYDFGEIKHYRKIKKILFMIKSDIAGSYLKFSHGNYLGGYSIGNYSTYYYSKNSTSVSSIFSTHAYISIKSPNVWELVEIPLTSNFRYIGIMSTSVLNATIKVDDIQLYGLSKKYYEGNVIKLNYKLNKKNLTLYDAEIGQYDQALNDEFFAWRKKIATIEENNQE